MAKGLSETTPDKDPFWEEVKLLGILILKDYSSEEPIIISNNGWASLFEDYENFIKDLDDGATLGYRYHGEQLCKEGLMSWE